MALVEVNLDTNGESYFDRNDNEHSFREASGKSFETKFIAYMNAGLKSLSNDPRYVVKKATGTKYDEREGTDAVIGNMRIDPTLNFSNKKFMPFYVKLSAQPITGYNFMVGMRHGNDHKGYTGFPQTVVVIGLDMPPSVYNNNETKILNYIKNNAKQLTDIMYKCLTDYTTTDPEERKNIAKVPFRTNSNYTEPDGIEGKYKHYNALQRSLRKQSKGDKDQNEKDERIHPDP